jgi:CO dehydrogenase maturation factor
LLGTVETQGRAVIADFEAGIGTLTRLQPGDVDAVLIVVEPTPKSIEVGLRCADIAREKELGETVVVGSRVASEADAEMIAKAFAGCEIVTVPFGDGITHADREGVAPLDIAPNDPAVRALGGLADRLIPA